MTVSLSTCEVVCSAVEVEVRDALRKRKTRHDPPKIIGMQVIPSHRPHHLRKLFIVIIQSQRLRDVDSDAMMGECSMRGKRKRETKTTQTK